MRDAIKEASAHRTVPKYQVIVGRLITGFYKKCVQGIKQWKMNAGMIHIKNIRVVLPPRPERKAKGKPEPEAVQGENQPVRVTIPPHPSRRTASPQQTMTPPASSIMPPVASVTAPRGARAERSFERLYSACALCRDDHSPRLFRRGVCGRLWHYDRQQRIYSDEQSCVGGWQLFRFESKMMNDFTEPKRLLNIIRCLTWQ